MLAAPLLTPRRAPSAPCAAPVLTLRTFGECRIEVAPAPHLGAPVVLAPDTDRLFSLALLLAGERGRPVPRGRVAEWLWPELDATRGRRCLRQALYRLRLLGVPVLATADHLRVDTAAVALTFAAAPSAARLATEWRTGTLRFGRCLPGWAPAARPLMAWVDAYRARTEGEARTALTHALDAALAPGSPTAGTPETGPDAAVLAHALLELDPAHPTAARVIAHGPNGAGSARLVREDGWAGMRYRSAATWTGGPAPLPCVGRVELLATLTTRLRQAMAGRGGLVVLAGPPGAGTSCVLGTFTDVAAREGVRVLPLRGHASAPGRAYSLVAALARELLDAPGALGATPTTIAALRRLALDHMPGAPAGGSAARLLAGRLAELAAAVAGEGPLLVALDDVQHADAPSLAVLAQAAGAWRGEPVLAVAACAGTWPALTGPGAGNAWPGLPGTGSLRPRVEPHGVEPDGMERHAVPPLSSQAAAALARAAAAAAHAALSDADAAWCAVASRRLPGDVIVLARHCATRPGSRSAPPELAERVAVRVAALPPRTRGVLEVAAALGIGRLTPERLAHALGGVRAARRGLGALRAAAVVDAEGWLHPLDARAALAAVGLRDGRAMRACTAGPYGGRAAGHGRAVGPGSLPYPGSPPDPSSTSVAAAPA